MIKGLILLAIALVCLWFIFCGFPGKQTRQEEKETKHSNWSDYIKEEDPK